MIFVGDIAAPDDLYPVEPHFRDVAPDEPVIANLEGAIHDGGGAPPTGKALYNHPGVLSYLEQNNVRVVSLANNHIFDVGSDIQATTGRLDERRIQWCGAGPNRESAARPCVIESAGKTRVFLAFGWTPIKCRPVAGRGPGVNPMTAPYVIASVATVRAAYPGATLVLLMHWNFELELYPMPLQRALAFRAIDAGADAVIGCHPHCVQGVEVYKGAPVVYSLGNWFLAQNVFFGGKLRFPDFASRQLAFQWHPETGEMVCRWFEYSRADHSVAAAGEEPLSESSEIARLTPFDGMDHTTYAHWFRSNRRKRRLLPVYVNPDAALANGARDAWVGGRQRLIDAAFALRLKGGPR